VDTPSKVCTACGIRKPNTYEYFGKRSSKSKVSGKRWEYTYGKCKACTYERGKELDRNYPTPERYIYKKWVAICKRSKVRGVSIADNLRAKDGVKYFMGLWEKQNGLCAITGVPMTWGSTERKDLIRGKGLGRSVSIDRINNAHSYRKGNIQLVCAQVNFMRSSLSIEDFVAWCKLVAKNQSLD